MSDVAPERLDELDRHLTPIGWRGDPFAHFGWYAQLNDEEKQAVIAHARAVHDLVRRLGGGTSSVSRYDAVQHAYAILGFYESNTDAGDAGDLRDRYVADTITSWRRRTGHRMIYSAANAHTTASPRMLISFPDDEPGDDTVERRLAGGRLRNRYGRRYVSIGTVFQQGQVLTGWEVRPGGPAVYDVPPPHASFVDVTLGQAREPDYLLDLHSGTSPAVRRWLDGPAKMRIIGSAYVAGNDANYSQSLDSWRAGFDAILHVNHVTASRLLSG